MNYKEFMSRYEKKKSGLCYFIKLQRITICRLIIFSSEKENQRIFNRLFNQINSKCHYAMEDFLHTIFTRLSKSILIKIEACAIIQLDFANSKDYFANPMFTAFFSNEALLINLIDEKRRTLQLKNSIFRFKQLSEISTYLNQLFHKKNYEICNSQINRDIGILSSNFIIKPDYEPTCSKLKEFSLSESDFNQQYSYNGLLIGSLMLPKQKILIRNFEIEKKIVKFIIKSKDFGEIQEILMDNSLLQIKLYFPCLIQSQQLILDRTFYGRILTTMQLSSSEIVTIFQIE